MAVRSDSKEVQDWGDGFRRCATDVEQVTSEPSDYLLHHLGPVPDHRETWKRAATILYRHHYGVDQEPEWTRSSLLGSSRERAEAIARLEVMSLPREHDGVVRTVERDIGLDLFG